MNKAARATILCSCLLILLAACHRKPVSSSTNLVKDTTNYALLNFHPKVLEFDYLHIKSKVHYADEKNDYKFTVNTRIKHDSLIWMSITGGPGVEVARALIRKDSILVLDKMNNQLFRYGFDYIKQTLNVDADYAMLESMIAGNLPVKLKNEDSLGQVNSNGMEMLFQRRGEYYISNGIDTTSMRMHMLDIEQPAAGNKMELRFKNFAPLDSVQVANVCDIKTYLIQQGRKKETTIEVQHNKIEISQKPLSFPFNIPNKYEENIR